MNDSQISGVPKAYPEIKRKSKSLGFSMPSDIYIGSLLKTLISSKKKSNILELGTGIGFSLCWMIDGLDKESKLITIDNNPELIQIAKDLFGSDSRVEIICEDGSKWINNYKGEKFDLIFADAWPGKYSDTEQVLDLIKDGGFYVIDDMSTQPNWPKGHEDNVIQLIDYLEKRCDFSMTKMDWSTGVIIMTKL